MMKDHLLDRTVMMWGVKYKANVVKNGKLTIQQECKVMTPIKYLTPEHMSNIKAMLEKNPGVWNGYDSDIWIHALKNEFIYRNKRADVIIKEAIKLAEFNTLGKIFRLHREEAFKLM